MSEHDNYQPDQPYPLPPVRINLNRPVEHEEMTNNMQALMEVPHDLLHLKRFEESRGHPMATSTDDYDNERLVIVPMDREWRNMVWAGYAKERTYLEKKGIIFPK